MNKYRVNAMIDGTKKTTSLTVYCEGDSNDAIAEAFYQTYGTQGFAFCGAQRIETANASKDEERAALTQIQAIVASLGEYSYLGTAFKGCFDIARQNIDNDWADSLHDRLSQAEQKLEEAARRVRSFGNELESSARQHNAEVEQLKAKIEELEGDEHDLRSELSAAQEKQVKPWLYNLLHTILQDDVGEAEAQMAKTADSMAEYIALGKTEDSVAASKEYRRLKGKTIEARNAIEALDELVDDKEEG